MKSNYQEKKEARIEKYTNRAAQNRQTAASLFKQSHDMTSCIPMGQPILVGHHSERGHRRLIEKSWNKLGQGVAALNKAEHYESKAEAAQCNNAISSDDPEAVNKLVAKLDKLAQYQEDMKAANKIIKNKKFSEVEKVDRLMKEVGFSEKTAIETLAPDFCGRVGFPSYALSNNNANIKTIKDRIERLKKVASYGDQEITIGDVKMIASGTDNRVKLYFQGKPAETIRAKLKGYGFRWAPSEGAWMLHLSNAAIWKGKEIMQLATN